MQGSGIHAQQCRCKPGVPDMHLGRFDQSIELAHMPRWKCFEQENPLQQRHVVPDGRPADLKRPGQLAHVEKTRRSPGDQFQQFRQYVQRTDTSQVAHVALYQRLHIGPVPVAPAARIARQCRRVSARNDASGQLIAHAIEPCQLESSIEQLRQKTTGPAIHLALRQRMKPLRLNTPGK